MSDDSNNSPRKAGRWWMPAMLAIAVALAVGFFGGTMFTSLGGALFGEEQEPGLDDAGNVERRAERLAGTGPAPPVAIDVPADDSGPVPEEVTEAVETVETVDPRAEERRTLAYESPLTPPVADIAERIRKRQEKTAAQAASTAETSDMISAASAPETAVTPGPPADVPHHQLYRGSVIPAVLESAIDSDLPGLVRARTTRDVRDSLTGNHVLIPRGSRLIGTYGQGAAAGGQGARNRRRLFVAWEEIRLPDGTPVKLDNFSALGADGASGIKARRATGFLEALGAAVLFDLAGNATAILTAATGIGQRQSETGALANAISGALGNSTQKVGADYVGSLLASGPRFRVKAGSFMNVIVEQDIMLPAAGSVIRTRELEQ